jgi:hypothetical protein
MRLQFGDRNGFVRNLTRNGEPMRFTTENDLTADDCALGPRTIVFDFINMRRPGPRALPAGQARFEHVRYTGTSAPRLGSSLPHLHRDSARPTTSAPGLGSPHHICTGTRLAAAAPALHRDSARPCAPGDERAAAVGTRTVQQSSAAFPVLMQSWLGEPACDGVCSSGHPRRQCWCWIECGMQCADVHTACTVQRHGLGMQVKSVFLQQALLKEYRALDHEVLKADFYDSDQVR